MHRSLKAIALGAALLAAACAVTPASPADPMSPTVSPRRTDWVSPTHSEEECRTLVGFGAPRADEMRNPPTAREIVIPPLDGVPSAQRGVRLEVQLFVDLHGAVVPDSTRIAPAISDPRYDHDLRASLARAKFRPGVIDGCAVPAWVTLAITLPVRAG